MRTKEEEKAINLDIEFLFHWVAEGGDYIKKKILGCVLNIMILLLVGCGSKQDTNIEEQKKDIRFSQPSGYYSNDTILIQSYNDYKCIGTKVSYDEQTGIYTCIVEFNKIIAVE